MNVPGVSKLWDIKEGVNRVESAEPEDHVHFLDQTASRRRWRVSGLGWFGVKRKMPLFVGG
jgi:hypothetical protein